MAHPTARTLNETLSQDSPIGSEASVREADAAGRFEVKYFDQLKTDKEGRLWVNSDVLAQRLDAIASLLDQLLSEQKLQTQILAQGLNVNAETL